MKEGGAYKICRGGGFKIYTPPSLRKVFWPKWGGGGITFLPGANAALVLSSKNWRKYARWGAASKNKSKKPWTSIFILSPCVNRCRFSEIGFLLRRWHPPSKIKFNKNLKTLRWRLLRWRLTLSEILVVCNSYAEALFCALLRPFVLFCGLVFALFCAHLRSFELVCVFLRPIVFRTTAFGNCRG